MAENVERLRPTRISFIAEDNSPNESNDTNNNNRNNETNKNDSNNDDDNNDNNNNDDDNNNHHLARDKSGDEDISQLSWEASNEGTNRSNHAAKFSSKAYLGSSSISCFSRDTSKNSTHPSGALHESGDTGTLSSGESRARSGATSFSIGQRLLSIAKAREESEEIEIDLDEEVELLDPEEMSNEEIRYWTDAIAKSNKTKETESWMLERFWIRARYLGTPSRPRDAMQRQSDDSRSSLEEYDEITRGSSKRNFATFKTLGAALQETIGYVPGKNMRSSSISGRSRALPGVGIQKKPSVFTSKSRRTVQTVQSNSTTKSDSDLKLNNDHKLDIAVVQLRRMKEEKAEKKAKHEAICQNINSAIEQHKGHLKSVKKYRLLFSRERKRGCGWMSGDAVVKFYDDVLKHENHAIDVIRLSNTNLQRKAKFVMNNIRMREEGGNQFKLVDYQQLELFNDENQQHFASQASVLIAQKQLLGDCHFHRNRWRKRLDEAEEEGAKLKKETNMRKTLFAQLENENRAVIACKKEVNKECDELQALERDYVKPDLTSYVKQVASNHNLEWEVRTWERRIKLLRFTLGELTTSLRQLQTQSERDLAAKLMNEVVPKSRTTDEEVLQFDPRP